MSLGLINVTYEKKFDAASYADFYKTDDYNALVEMAEQRNKMSVDFPAGTPQHVIDIMKKTSRIEVIGGMVELTYLGSAFKNICLPQK